MVAVRLYIENPLCLSSHLLILALIGFVPLNCDSSGLSVLIICVYIPGEHNQNPHLSTLGELEDFIDSHESDVCLVIGGFNIIVIVV